MTGAQIGARILGRLSRRTLQLAFSVFLLLVAASLFLVIPSRDAVVELTPLLAIGAVGVGLLVGTFASVLGIGGGVMIIPALVVGFGASDLVARGTAIAMMVPTSLSGTISHVRAGRADLRVAALVAAPAIVTTGMGVVSAQAISPFWGAILFAALLTVVAAQLAWRVRRPE